MVIETPDVQAKSTRISDGCPRTIHLRLCIYEYYGQVNVAVVK